MIKFEKLPADILSRIPQVQEALLRDSRVLFAYLFGGLATGRVHPLSDVDLAVYLTDTGDLALYKLSLFENVTDALGTAELDLVVLNTAPISIAGRVLQNRRLLVDKDPFKRHAWESLTLRQFFDFRIKEEEFFARRYGIGR
jgi:predicted nucleotidyltransferase